MLPRALPPLLALAALLLAGCTAPAPAPGGPALPGPPSMAPALVGPFAVSREAPGAEPVIAVASDGTLFVEGIGFQEGPGGRSNVNKAWRSRDGGATWEDITPAGLGQERSNDGFVAVGNGDAVYVANVAMLTLQLFRSDDLGASWTALQPLRLPLLMHRHWVVPHGEATVHLAVEALPPGFLARPAGGLTPNEGLWYLRSDDRGVTWSLPRQVDPVVNFAGQGNLVASGDGEALYVLRYEDDAGDRPEYLGGLWYLLASEDGGATWERRDAFRLTSELAAAVPSLALDPAGALHMAWAQEAQGTSRVHLATSPDGGRTWGAPLLLGDPRGTQAMPWMDAKAPGRLALMWYAADVPGTAAAVDAPWHVDFAVVEGAGSPSPEVRVARATPEPVHQGNICAKGPACGQGEDRRLLDYPWLDVGPDGRAHLAFASTMWERPSAFAVYAAEAPPPPAEPGAGPAEPGAGPARPAA